eukprot:TRINITY_DN9710_c0_g1_i1.p1 TRINITY_DN9710_c0_g1~~TRINITY_DN9710_c0_g1_i1.p1  ORF type:complete len:349 (-),score=30.65 TRINITY_DN9710_c0_g1_i1:34-1080(-)
MDDRHFITGSSELTWSFDNCVCMLELWDGTVLVGSNTGLLSLWSKHSIECLHTYRHSHPLRSLFELDQDRVVIGDYAGSVCIWSQNRVNNTSSVVFRFDSCPSSPLRSVWSIVKLKQRSFDGGILLASGSSDLTICIWNVNDGKCVQTLIGHHNFVQTLYVMQNGDLLSGSSDCTVRIWSIEGDSNEFVMKETIKVHRPVDNVLELKNGLIACGEKSDIKIWKRDVSNWSCIRTLVGHKYSVRNLIEVDNGLLVSGSNDRTIRVWRERDATCLTVFTSTEKIRCLLLLRDGSLIYGDRKFFLAKTWIRVSLVEYCCRTIANNPLLYPVDQLKYVLPEELRVIVESNLK